MVGSVGPILSSSVGVTYDGAAIEEENGKKKTNVGLIVGVVIGSVVVLGILGFLIYKFALKKNPMSRINEGASDVELQDSKKPKLEEKAIYA